MKRSAVQYVGSLLFDGGTHVCIFSLSIIIDNYRLILTMSENKCNNEIIKGLSRKYL